MHGRGRAHAPLQQHPFPLPPPPPPIASGSGLGSGSAAPALGPAFVPSSTSVPPPPISASSSTAHPSGQILTSAQLAARFAALPPLQPQRRSTRGQNTRGQSTVSVNYYIPFYFYILT